MEALMQLSGLQYEVGDRYICKKEDSRGGGSLDAAQWTAIWSRRQVYM